MNKFGSDKGDYVAAMGYPGIYTAKVENKELIIASLMKYYLFYR